MQQPVTAAAVDRKRQRFLPWKEGGWGWGKPYDATNAADMAYPSKKTVTAKSWSIEERGPTSVQSNIYLCMIILVVIWLPFWLPFLLSVIYDNNITTSFNQSSSDKLWHPLTDLHITTTIVLPPKAGSVDVYVLIWGKVYYSCNEDLIFGPL